MRRDFAITRALHYASTGNYRWQVGIGFTGTYEGVTVIRARPNLAYGHSVTRRARFSHRVSKVFIAFHRGRVVGQLVRWRCGGTSMNFKMTESLSSRFPPCINCNVQDAGTVILVVNQ